MSATEVNTFFHLLQTIVSSSMSPSGSKMNILDDQAILLSIPACLITFMSPSGIIANRVFEVMGMNTLKMRISVLVELVSSCHVL